MPVLPLVASRMVCSGRRRPVRSPSRIMLRPARSLTDPPGLKYSALAQMATPGNSRPIFSRRSNGVLPIVDNRFLAWVRTGSGRSAAAMVYCFGLAGGAGGCRIHLAIIAKSVEIGGIVQDWARLCVARPLHLFWPNNANLHLRAS